MMREIDREKEKERRTREERERCVLLSTNEERNKNQPSLNQTAFSPAFWK